MRNRQRSWWASLSQEERSRRIRTFMQAPNYEKGKRTVAEKLISSMGISGLKYVGDGSLFVTFKPKADRDRALLWELRQSDIWHKNPDFVYKEEGKVTKVVEVMDFAYWHTHDEAAFVCGMYRNLGYDCLVIDAKHAVDQPRELRGELEAFCNNHHVRVDNVKLHRSPCLGTPVYDLRVEETGTFFVTPGNYRYGSGPKRLGCCGSTGKPVLSSNCHAITPAGYQAFLKALEEPPPSSKFVLLTTDPEALPRTVLSRCVHLRLSSVSVPDISLALVRVAKHLKITLTPEDCNAVAEAAGGRVRDALHLLEQALALKDADQDPVPVAALVPRLTGDNFNRVWDVLKAVEEHSLREALSLSLEIDRFLELLPLCLNFVVTDRVLRGRARVFNDMAPGRLRSMLESSLSYVGLVRVGAPAAAVRTMAILQMIAAVH